MAAIPDQGMPGSDLLAQQPTQDDLLNAYGAGYTHDDMMAAGFEPARPDIGEIWGGTSPDQATWSDAANAGPEQYSRWDTTQLPSNPYALDTPEQARSQIDQLVESGMGIGAIESTGAKVVTGVISRAAQMGVAPTTEGLTAKSAADFVVQDVLDTTSQALGRMGLSNKWVRRGFGVAAAEGAFNNPGGTGAK